MKYIKLYENYLPDGEIEEKFLSDYEIEKDIIKILHLDKLNIRFDFINYYYVNSYFYNKNLVFDLMRDGDIILKDSLYINRRDYFDLMSDINRKSSMEFEKDGIIFCEKILSKKLKIEINIKSNSIDDTDATKQHYFSKTTLF